jgi:hypothetical protein
MVTRLSPRPGQASRKGRPTPARGLGSPGRGRWRPDSTAAAGRRSARPRILRPGAAARPHGAGRGARKRGPLRAGRAPPARDDKQGGQRRGARGRQAAARSAGASASPPSRGAARAVAAAAFGGWAPRRARPRGGWRIRRQAPRRDAAPANRCQTVSIGHPGASIRRGSGATGPRRFSEKPASSENVAWRTTIRAPRSNATQRRMQPENPNIARLYTQSCTRKRRVLENPS